MDKLLSFKTAAQEKNDQEDWSRRLIKKIDQEEWSRRLIKKIDQEEWSRRLIKKIERGSSNIFRQKMYYKSFFTFFLEQFWSNNYHYFSLL